MEKDKNKKITLEELVARKLQRDKEKLAVKAIYIESLGGELIFKKIKDVKILELAGKIEDNKVSELYPVFVELIYESCDMLQSAELHKKCEITDPLDIVAALLPINDVLEVGTKLLEFFEVGEKLEEAKN